jgi:hypothetical protein
MKARLHSYQPITECSGREMQQLDASFATRWAGIVVSSLGDSGICAKGGGQG